MVNIQSPQLDLLFYALSDATRRQILALIRMEPKTVTELAEPFKMALPSFMQHLQVLEASGLVRSSKQGRVRTVQIVPNQLQHAAGWLQRQRSIWERRLDQLDAYVQEMEGP